MLTEVKLKNLKPKDKAYKVADKDGLYALVTVKGSISFRYNYKINGRYETYSFGVWKKDVTLAEAREKLVEVKKLIAEGVSPMAEKRRVAKAINDADTIEQWIEKYLAYVTWADSTRNRRMYTINNHILKRWGKWKLHELSFDIVRRAVDEISDSGAPATAIDVRDLIANLFDFARDRGHRYENVAREIKPSSIHVFKPKQRVLNEREIAYVCLVMKKISTLPQYKLAIKVLMLTLVRKSMLQKAKWDEVDFEKGTWTIPDENVKMARAHVVYLSKQAMDCLIAMNMLANGSEYVLPALGNPNKTSSNSTLNRTCNDIVAAATDFGLDLAHFSPHCFRHTASTLLNEYGYNSDWVEKALNHEEVNVRAVYNKAQYAEQRRKMLQDWADKIDEWCKEYEGDLGDNAQFKTIRQLRMSKK